jgi:hypothetical protein
VCAGPGISGSARDEKAIIRGKPFFDVGVFCVFDDGVFCVVVFRMYHRLREIPRPRFVPFAFGGFSGILVFFVFVLSWRGAMALAHRSKMDADAVEKSRRL